MPLDLPRLALSLLGALGVVTVGGAGLVIKDRVEAAGELDGHTKCRAIDGDTIVCDGERIRLIGIDAPEMGPCPQYRLCAPGDPMLSKYSLENGMEAGPVQIEAFGVDHYGRTLAMAWAGETNLSCWQLAEQAAVYVGRYDEDDRVKIECHR